MSIGITEKFDELLNELSFRPECYFLLGFSAGLHREYRDHMDQVRPAPHR